MNVRGQLVEHGGSEDNVVTRLRRKERGADKAANRHNKSCRAEARGATFQTLLLLRPAFHIEPSLRSKKLGTRKFAQRTLLKSKTWGGAKKAAARLPLLHGESNVYFSSN